MIQLDIFVFDSILGISLYSTLHRHDDSAMHALLLLGRRPSSQRAGCFRLFQLTPRIQKSLVSMAD